MGKLLIVDDEVNVTRSLNRALRDESFEVTTANCPLEALAIASHEQFDVVLSDQRMPEMTGPEFLTELAKQQPGCSRLAMSAHQDFESMIDMFNTGLIEHFLPKPWNNKDVRELIRTQMPSASSESKRDRYDSIVTNDPGMHELFSRMSQLVDHTVPVFIYGETGTGKELVARALHNQAGLSGRFVAVNCSNLNMELLESQLFGHKKGAFTGAATDQQGLLSAAENGTLFLDEVTDLPPVAQNKLLRALQEHVYTPLGCTKEVQFNCRIVSAASTRMHDAVQSGDFRADLMYRLEVIPLSLPPLRERQGDILLLFKHFTGRIEICTDVESAILSYSWPGNIRELQNAAAHVVAFTRSDEPVNITHLPEKIRRSASRSDSIDEPSVRKSSRLDRKRIAVALEKHGNNRSAAARELGVSRMTLYRHLNQA